MAKSRSTKSKFLSNYGDADTYITAAQYVTEFLCTVVAKQKKMELCPKFWNHPDWSKFFRSQIPAANLLLKEYDIQAIIDAIKDKRCWNLRSLRAWFLKPIIAEKQKFLSAKKEQEKSSELKVVETNEQPRQPIALSKKSTFDILRELENIDGCSTD